MEQKTKRSERVATQNKKLPEAMTQDPVSNSQRLAQMPPVRKAQPQPKPPPGPQPKWAAPLDKEGGRAPEKSFVEKGIRGQMTHMAKLMQSNRGMLDANGVSAPIERNMAAQIPREIGTNSRRKSLSSSYQRQGRGLLAQMKKQGITDPNELTGKKAKRLTEEQRFLLSRAQAGELDLNKLKDPKAAKENQETYANLGVEKLSSQYAEMEELRKKGKKARTPKERRRLRELEGKSSRMGSGIGKVWGLSQERFAEIYAPGNTRFERSHYQRLRDSYIKNNDKNDTRAEAYSKNPKRRPPSDTVLSRSGIGNFDISKEGQEKIKTSGTYDILGDIATSYGATQTMGGYGASDDWQGRSAKAERLQPVIDENGQSYTPTFDDLQKSGAAHDPNTNDLKIQMSVLKMGMAKKKSFDRKGLGLAQTNMSNDKYIRMYNGHKPGDKVYRQYMSSLRTNGPVYEQEKAKLNPKKPKKKR